ncbi:YcgJ family protein [Photobacterium profundum]|uniref:YcgJ family protein n=1 Tax=Photobacterium profundum TaxID=74109 RepID=UPI003D123377
MNTIHLHSIRIKQLVTLILFAIMSGSASAAMTELAPNIYSPDKGVICDKKAGFCVDSFGISMAFTQEYLGDDAQKEMMKVIETVGTKNFDTTRYSLSNGVYCDSLKQGCFKSRFNDTPEVKFSNVLFK